MSVVTSTAIVPDITEVIPTEVFIALSYSNAYPDVKRHLSTIGKRTANKAGENIFSMITLSSAEEPILQQYIQQATHNVVAAIEQFVSNYSENTTGVTFKVTNTRWKDPTTPDFVGTFAYSFKKYVVMYTVAEYLSMNFPELAQKYFDAALQALQAIIRLVFFKAPQTAADVVRTLSFGTTPIGQSSYEFVVPTDSLIGMIVQNVGARVTIMRGIAEASADVVVRRDDGSTALFPGTSSHNSFTGHDDYDITNAQYISANKSAIGTFIHYKPDTIDAIQADDILKITPST